MTLRKLFNRIVTREQKHPVLTYPFFLWRVAVCRRRYRKTLARLRMKVAAGKKLRVVFLSMDTAKWKCQSLYDAMARSPHFDPVVALTITDEDGGRTAAQIDARNRVSRAFYERHGCKVVEACDPVARTVVSPSELGADLVFFQVPWGNFREQTPWRVSEYALTAYVPYSMDNVEWAAKTTRFDFMRMADFHQLMWLNVAWSDAFARYLLSSQFGWEWAGRQVGLGHTTLDAYADFRPKNALGELVIYAPHFSFSWECHHPIMNFSTFPWSGKAMLAYAQSHPEIKWAFKPHPKLREYLVDVGFMSPEEVDAYYSSWEKLGESCYDGDYAELFKRSRAMVTDCASFLFEYMPIGKPLIRLIPDDIKVRPFAAAREVFDSFYNCHSWNEAMSAMKLVLEKGEDPKREGRWAACRRANLLDNNCAKRVMDWLEGQLVVASVGRVEN